MRVVEIGSYVIPGYAGMLLAEQGHRVDKWIGGPDPIQGLERGDELWAWINAGKTLVARRAEYVRGDCSLLGVDVVIDNLRPSTWARWGIDRETIADERGLAWVSVQADVGERSFDVVAQAQGWGDRAPWVPFYIGDTAVGLWLAFKAVSMVAAGETGHRVLYQSSLMAKLVEGEDVIDVPRHLWRTAWDDPPDIFTMVDGPARVEFKGQVLTEPRRDRAWRLANLHHDGTGRYRV